MKIFSVGLIFFIPFFQPTKESIDLAVGWVKKEKLLNPFWSRSFPELFGSTDNRTVKTYIKG